MGRTELKLEGVSDREGRRLISDFSRQGFVQARMERADVSWRSRPKGGRWMDLAFVPKWNRGKQFVGVDILDRGECIGMVVGEDGEDCVRIERQMRADEQMRGLMDQGAQVAVVSKEDLRAYVDFYDQIEEEGILERVGDRSSSFSGLRRYTRREHVQLERALGAMYEANSDYLRSCGVKRILRNRGKLDVGFENKQGELLAIPMHHVRLGELQGEVLVERVLSKKVWVPGVVVRQEGENKREAYRRAENLRRYWSGRFDIRVEVPVISAGQISLWDKLGVDNEASIERPDSADWRNVRLTAEDLIRLLYLGESNVEPGELTKLGYSLPGLGGEFSQVDVVLYNRDVSGNRAYGSLDGLAGLDLGKWKRGGFGVKSLDNVGGFVVVPSGWDKKEIKEHLSAQEYPYWYRTRRGKHLLVVNEELFEYWRENGSIFHDQDRETGEAEIDGAGDGYGVWSGGPDEISLEVVRTEPEIGGVRMFVRERSGGEVQRHALDAGVTFESQPRGLKTLLATPSTSLGVRRHLERGVVPMIPGLVTSASLLAGVEHFPALWTDEDLSYTPVGSYHRAELVHRGLFDEVREIVGKRRAKKIFKYGAKDEEWWYQGGDESLSSIVISHAHMDHCGILPYYANAPVVGRAETMAVLRAITRRKQTWRGEMISIAQLTEPRMKARGRPYQRIWRELKRVDESDALVPVSQDIGVEMSLVNHSLVGAAMTGVSSVQNGPLLVYTGDVKPGPITDETLGRLEGKYPVIVTETTNVKESEKSSVGVTEEVVVETMSEVVAGNKGNLVVAVTPPNHMERLGGVLEVAGVTGRKVALGPAHAEMVQHLAVTRQKALLGGDGFGFGIPRLGEDVAVWAPPKTQPRKFEKHLRRKAAMGELGVVDQETLSLEGSDWIVMMGPYQVLENRLGGIGWGNQGLAVVHSSYYVYDKPAKWHYAANLGWVGNLAKQGVKARYYSDFDVYGDGGRAEVGANYEEGGKVRGLHASGHATFEEMFEMIHGLLGGVYRGKKLVLVHGQHPYLYKQAFEERLGLDNGELKIVAKVDRYDPRQPLSKPGHEISLI